MAESKTPKVIVYHWGTCPDCIKERPTDKLTGLMANHYKWVRSGQYGCMVPCDGSGEKPLPPIK